MTGGRAAASSHSASRASVRQISFSHHGRSWIGRAKPGYQTRGTAYASKILSADTIVALSQRA